MNRRSPSGATDRLRRYLGSIVEVHLLDGKVLRGKLTQVDDDLLNLFLEEVEDSEGRRFPAVCISGGSITYISVVTIPLRGLGEETLEEKVLSLLRKNSHLTPEEIARLLDTKPSSVKMAISRLRRKGLLRGLEEDLEGARS